MEKTITAPFSVLEGTFNGSRVISSAHKRFPAKMQFSADVSKGWRNESKQKVPRMDSSVRFTNGPEPGRSKNSSTVCGPRATYLKRGVQKFIWFSTCWHRPASQSSRSLNKLYSTTSRPLTNDESVWFTWSQYRSGRFSYGLRRLVGAVLRGLLGVKR